jgi:hypothetical protein
VAQSRRSFGADPRLEAYALGYRLEAYATLGHRLEAYAILLSIPGQGKLQSVDQLRLSSIDRLQERD